MIDLKNETVSNYVKFKLDRIDNNFTENDLSKLDELFINNEEESFDIRLLSFFSGLKRIELLNFLITNEDINILKSISSLKDITFDNCSFEDADEIGKLKIDSLSLINSQINNYEFVYKMNNLKELTITNANINISGINKLVNLSYLRLSYCIILDNETINIEKLKKLYIDNTNILDLTFIEDIKDLKVLSISNNQYLNNKELVKEFKNFGLIVLNENMSDFEGENYE